MRSQAEGMGIKRMKDQDPFQNSRILYIIEATLEYFISIAVGTVYLAKITTYIGMSSALTGILSAFVSLGCGFQLVAVFLANKRPVKRWVTVGHIISQILFASVYFVPLLPVSAMGKTVIFIIVLLIGYIIHNAINSPKINWFMSLVDNERRGRFTANKEIVSLISGIAFSYGLGAVMDYFEKRGDIQSAFTVCGIGLMVMMVLHSLTLIFSKEKTVEPAAERKKVDFKAFLHNKTLFKIIVVSVLWNIANYATVSFTGTYQARELAFTATFSSVIIMVGSLIRALVSRPIGRFADKTSFRRMLSLCFVVEAVSFGINIFTHPNNGTWMYMLYYVLHCIGMAGINSAIINFIYDYVAVEQRTSALAIQQTLAGFAGFFIVLLLSPIVEWMQHHPILLLGETVYAQQVMSAFSCVVTVLIIVYLNTVIKKLPKVLSE